MQENTTPTASDQARSEDIASSVFWAIVYAIFAVAVLVPMTFVATLVLLDVLL